MFRKKAKYPKKCPFCKKKKWLAKSWGQFPDRILEKGGRTGLRLLTIRAEDEWFNYVVCFNCYRIIWHEGDAHGGSTQNIPLRTLQELTGWQNLPYNPTVFYDKKGNPVYGTKRSKEIYC